MSVFIHTAAKGRHEKSSSEPLHQTGNTWYLMKSSTTANEPTANKNIWWAFLPLRKTVTDIGCGPYLVGGVVDDDEDNEDAGLARLPHRRPHQLDPLEEQTAAVRRDQQQLRRVAPVAPSGGRQHRRRLAQQLNRSNTSRCRNASRKHMQQDCAESLLAFRQSKIDRDLRDGIAIWVEIGADRSVSDGTSYLRGKYFVSHYIQFVS